MNHYVLHIIYHMLFPGLISLFLTFLQLQCMEAKQLREGSRLAAGGPWDEEVHAQLVNVGRARSCTHSPEREPKWGSNKRLQFLGGGRKVREKVRERERRWVRVMKEGMKEGRMIRSVAGGEGERGVGKEDGEVRQTQRPYMYTRARTEILHVGSHADVPTHSYLHACLSVDPFIRRHTRKICAHAKLHTLMHTRLHTNKHPCMHACYYQCMHGDTHAHAYMVACIHTCVHAVHEDANAKVYTGLLACM